MLSCCCLGEPVKGEQDKIKKTYFSQVIKVANDQLISLTVSDESVSMKLKVVYIFT